MRIPRLYQSIPLAVGQKLQLDAQATVHVAKVLRLREGDFVVVFNGQGGEYQGMLVRLEKRSATVHLQGYRDTDLESPLKILLAQGISRGERMDYTVQKTVELGVHSIVPLMTERTVVNLDAERQGRRVQHWQTIVNSACEQCGRNFVPRVDEVASLPHWLQAFVTAEQANRYVLNHRAKLTLGDLRVDPRQPVYVLIGPEGGLSDHEVQQSEQAGFVPVRLGPRVLRTETAALAFIAALQAKWGDYY